MCVPGRWTTFVPVLAAALVPSNAVAQQSPSGAKPREFSAPSVALAQDAPASQKAPAKADAKADAKSDAKAGGESSGDHRYREISDFFNIREAYSNVVQGEWEFEVEMEWETRSGERDEYGPAFSLKYGVTDTFHAAIEVLPIRLGDGGDKGNGDLALILFNQFWAETDVLPAFGAWAQMRIPSGEGSSGVDGELHFNLTKQVASKCRAHLEGFIMTANGSRGGDDDDRRNFQWGVGPGFDYSLSDDTIFNINYINRSSDEVGHHNENIIEFGVAQRIAENQHIKAALDVGLDGATATPNLAAKLVWSIEWH